MGKLKRLFVLRKPKFFLPLAVVLLIAAAFWLAARNLNSPAVGTVTTQVTDTTAGEIKSMSTYKTYSDSVVSFNYPYIYVAQAGQKSSGYLDVIELRKTQQRTEFASIGIYAGALADEPGINYRRGHPELYKLVSGSNNTLIYSKIDSMEYTGFLQKGPDVVTISFTSVGAHDFAADYKRVADSLKLKQ